MEAIKKLMDNTKAKVITFGIDKDADYTAENINFFSRKVFLLILLKVKDEGLYPIKLNVIGKHNIYNSLASIAAAHIYGIPMEDIQKNISIYTGVHRR